MSVKKNKKSNIIIINKSELPLSCPREDYMKLSHPKIFLPIVRGVTISVIIVAVVFGLTGD